MSDVKTYNGWFNIEEVQPKSEEDVIVILERDSSPGCTYAFIVRESTYRIGYPKNYFLAENERLHVKYWRRKELIPYPDEVVMKEIEDCRSRNVSFQDIINHQHNCGIEVNIT